MRNSVFLFSLAAALLAGSCCPLQASDSSQFVYVESNLPAANANSVYAFSRGSDGNLKPVPGSPFLTGGAGVQYSGPNLGPLDSDQEVITNQQQTLLFAVNAGSDSIAVFHIEESGALKPVEGSPFPSGGNDPVSLALDGSTLLIVNQSGDFGRPSTVLPNYTMMRINGEGKLFSISSDTNDTSRPLQTTVSVAGGSSPSQAYFAAGSNVLFGADFLGGLLEHFVLNGVGQLQALPPIGLPASEFDATTPRLPLGLWSNPRHPILYVGYVTANKIGVYSYDQEGDLSFLRTVPNSGQSICWIRSNQSGSRLYTSDTASNQVSVYNTADAEKPVEIQALTLSGVGNAFQLSLSADGQSMFVLSQRASASIPEGEGNVLHTLTIKSDGTVSETGSPIVFNLPGGVRPQGVAVVDR